MNQHDQMQHDEERLKITALDMLKSAAAEELNKREQPNGK